MITLLPFLLGAAGGALFVRERRERRAAERFAGAALESLLNAIDANDPETGAHVRRVACYSLTLAESADLDERQRRSVERIALFHDIGKVHQALFDIIHDAEELSEEDRQKIELHPECGASVLSPLAAFYPDLAEGVMSHHECWDGSGYPRGLRGEEIPLASRIVAIADTFDAITHRRTYSAGRSAREAAQAIAEGRAIQFDPDLTDLFLSPPVFDQITRSLGNARKPQVRIEDRRAGKREKEISDITFRWRSGGFGQPAQDLSQQAMR